MLKSRIISFPLLIAAFALMLYYWQYGIFVISVTGIICAGLLARELSVIFSALGMPCRSKITIAESVCASVICMSESFHFALASSTVFIIFINSFFAVELLALAVLIFLEFYETVKPVFVYDKITAVKSRLVSCGISVFVVLIILPMALLLLRPARYMMFFIVATKTMDTGGYIFGMLSSYLPGGNHKIAPAVSPKKSWEGFAGGLLLNAAAVYLMWKYAFPSASLVFSVISGIILGIGSFFGDLTESGVKRAAGIKDSGNLLPGMGGVFDVLDSFIYNGWIFVILSAIFGF